MYSVQIQEGQQLRTSDDIIDAIAKTIIERDTFNHQRQKQSMAYCEQMKQALKAFEAMINTLMLANATEGDGLTLRQMKAALLKEVVDTMNRINNCRT